MIRRRRLLIQQTVMLALALAVLPLGVLAQSLGTCASGEVGLAAGASGPQAVLKINGLTGGTFHHVSVFPTSPIVISVDQPALNPSPARFVIFGAIGFPTASFAAPGPLGPTLTCFPFAITAPANPFLFTYADGVGSLMPPALLPGVTAPAPFSLTHPPLGTTGMFTLQGVIETVSGAFEVTNAVIVDVVDPSVAPQVLEITSVSLSGASPSSGSIPSTDSFRITFSEAIDASSLDSTENVTVRNLSVTSPEQPSGMLIPVSFTPSLSGEVLVVTPLMGLGPGLHQIEVVVGGSTTRPILDVAFSAQNPQLPLANSLTAVFTTQAAPAAASPVSVVDRFDTSLFEDTSYQPRWNPASWNVNGTLQGSVLSGSATGPVLGSRTQFVVNNQGPSVPATAGFFSPFDDNTLNNFGPSVNPNGGSRTQLLYLTLPQVNEIPTQITDSIELLEWGAHGGLSNPGLFNSFSLSLSHTSRSADPGVLSTPFAMSAIYNFNADFDNPQNAWLNPGAPPANQAPIQVVAPQIYFTPSLASTYIPFPSLLPTFDFDAKQTAINPVGGQTFRPNLLVDIDVVPPVFTSFNAIEGSLPTSPIPVRRLIGPSGANLAFSADAVAYRMRFTFVPKNASSRSTFHDVGSGPGTISWSSLDLFPDPSTQPVGSVSRVLIEGAPAVSGQQPIGGSGWQEYINRSGVIQPSALSALGSARFVRFQFEFVTNTPTGTAPSWDGFILGGTF